MEPLPSLLGVSFGFRNAYIKNSHQDQVHDVCGGESPQVVEGGGLKLRARHDDKVGHRPS